MTDRILVVGAGSTGGYFGGLLSRAGRDVTFLARQTRKAQIEQSGLVIRSRKGEFTLYPPVISRETKGAPFDVVLVAVKGQALPAAIFDMAGCVGPDSLILPLLNGMDHFDRLEVAFGRKALIGCVCKIGATLLADGSIMQLSDQDEIIYGEWDGSVSERIGAVDRMLAGAGFAARLSDDIQGEIWSKWSMIATIGAITCLMRAPIGQVVATPEGLSFAQGLFREVRQVVAVLGGALKPAFLHDMEGKLADVRSGQVSSLYRDMLAGAATEHQTVIGDLCDRARKFGVSTPLLDAARAHLLTYEQGLATHAGR